MTSRPWLSAYPEGVPAEIDTSSYRSLVDLMQESFRRYAERPAYSFLGQRLSFAELDQRSQQLGAYLQSLGLVRGDRVAIMLPNVLQYPIAVAAVLRAGFVVVNVNPLYTARELEYQLKDSGAKAIVIIENFGTVLQQCLANTPVQHVVLCAMGDQLSWLKGLLVNQVVRHVKKMVPTFELPTAVRFNEALARGAPLSLQQPEVGPDDLAVLQYTGGTTGVSKGAELLHRNLLANVLQSEAWNSPVMARHHRAVPGFRLQHIGQQVAVQQLGPFGHPRGTPGVLQHGQVIGAHLGLLQAQRRPTCQGLVETHRRGQLKGGHHLLDVTHHLVHQQAFEPAELVPHGAQHHMLHRRVGQALLQHRAKVFNDDNGLGARILELVLQLARGVERVDVDHHKPRSQHRGHRNGVLQHVGQHDGDPVASHQPQGLQVGSQLLAALVQFRKAQALTQKAVRRALGIAPKALLHEIDERAVAARVDLCRHTLRVGTQPGATRHHSMALTMSSTTFLASPNTIMVLSM